MIRRDYILRMIEEFVQTLARMNSLKRAQKWDEASDVLGTEFQRLIGAGPQAVVNLSETELLAKIVEGEPTQVVRDKTLMLVSLLNEAGEIATGKGRIAEARACYLKALHLLLETLVRSEPFEFPEFVPKVKSLVMALVGALLPLGSQAMLMQHYERAGDFANAHKRLSAMIAMDPHNDRLLQFGLNFYDRLLAQRDSLLASGNVSRGEIEQGRQKLERQCAENGRGR
jgi:hypothetical protein